MPSPKVSTYDLQPEMSAVELTDYLVAAIASGEQDLIVCNYANGDMVGHTGKMDAAIKAVEVLDACLARLEEAVLQNRGRMLITADHGNCEQMSSKEQVGTAHTAHTSNPVPLILVGDSGIGLAETGGTGRYFSYIAGNDGVVYTPVDAGQEFGTRLKACLCFWFWHRAHVYPRLLHSLLHLLYGKDVVVKDTSSQNSIGARLTGSDKIFWLARST